MGARKSSRMSQKSSERERVRFVAFLANARNLLRQKEHVDIGWEGVRSGQASPRRVSANTHSIYNSARACVRVHVYICKCRTISRNDGDVAQMTILRSGISPSMLKLRCITQKYEGQQKRGRSFFCPILNSSTFAVV